MLVDIFSSFDPATSLLFTVSPLLYLCLISSFSCLFISTKWISLNHHTIAYYTPTMFMYSQLMRGKSFLLKGLAPLIAPLFIFFILINLLGLTPYIFSLSSHLLLTMTYGIPLWMALVISSMTNSPKEFSANLLPSGAPNWLAPALVIIETISMLVRPLTLSFRLAANMSAGHIVLGLINMYSASALSITTSYATLSLISIGYTLFEVGICLVQAYIFCLLLSLYADDHSS